MSIYLTKLRQLQERRLARLYQVLKEENEYNEDEDEPDWSYEHKAAFKKAMNRVLNPAGFKVGAMAAMYYQDSNGNIDRSAIGAIDFDLVHLDTNRKKTVNVMSGSIELNNKTQVFIDYEPASSPEKLAKDVLALAAGKGSKVYKSGGSRVVGDW